ncbi:uncharacterized protein LOC129597475 [Paramacrobiotus metropolitanus]|uniref:uncharacterized protein LOC129597475 n=1 Tax=Paramacrobiotus metropolitanus TaxID=2943436 RepID=UPI0024461ED4|nr:uncharacterized protein LOC129597475 [Paramacrobiotus metropolitanus]
MADQNPGVQEELEIIRHYIFTILTAALTVTEKFPPCHGGIFRGNVFGVFDDDGSQPMTVLWKKWIKDQDSAKLGDRKNVLELWMKWINEGSSSVAYIPPEGIAALPKLAGNLEKVDSWALGCLAIDLINCDVPLGLKRQNRFGKSDHLRNGGTLQQLKEFYAGAGEPGLVVGPEMHLIKPVPVACEEFLARCLTPDPLNRWDLADLLRLPFLDLKRSLSDLFALDADYQQLLPIEGKYSITNTRPHPFMKSDPAMTVQVGVIQWLDSGRIEQKNVDIWRFVLFGDAAAIEESRQGKIKAFGKLVNVLTMMDSSAEARSNARADYCGIRALQQGTKNVVHHFGCQFYSHPSLPNEFQVFTEHCSGGNLRDAALYHIPVDVIGKWILEILEGLKYLHGHGLVHRNLNSSLIFFTENPFKGFLKIGGFHLMRQVVLEGDTSQKNGISARPGEDGRFVAPEMLDTQKESDLHTGRKCDTWSFGCIALHLASGQPPLYKGARDKPIELEMAVLYHLQSNKTLPEIPNWIPHQMRDFVITCLQFNPTDRPYAAELDTSGLLCVNIDDPVYKSARGGTSLPEGVVEYWRQ